MMCFMHEFTYICPPVITLNCVQESVCLCKSMRVCLCVHASVLPNRRHGDRWLRCPPHPCLSTAHAGGLRSSLRVCSVAGVFLPACVCRGSVLLSAATGIGAAAPDGIRERSASRQRALDSRGNTPDNTQETRRHSVFYGIFKYKVTAELKVIHSLTHRCFYCLIKDTLISPKVHCIIFCGCVWKMHSLIINYLVQLWYIVFIFEEQLKLYHQSIATYYIIVPAVCYWIFKIQRTSKNSIFCFSEFVSIKSARLAFPSAFSLYAKLS